VSVANEGERSEERSDERRRREHAGDREGTRAQNKLVEGVREVAALVKHDVIVSSPLIAQDIHIIVNNRNNKVIIKKQKQARRDDEQYIQEGDKRHDNLNEDIVIEH